MGGSVARWFAIELLVVTAVGAALGAVGPFGTSDVPLGLRLLVWIGFLVAGFACMRPIRAVAGWLVAEARLPEVLANLIACALASVPIAFLVVWVLAGMRLSAALARDDFATVYLDVLLVTGAVTLLVVLLRRRAAVALPKEEPSSPRTGSGVHPSAVPQAEGSADGWMPEQVRHDEDAGSVAASAPAPRFLDRLPPAIGRDLLALQMEDHYVRAHTALGDALLLLRMRDAVAELEGVEGARTHRSWWVARAAVTAVEREGRGVRLRLANGLVVPVARDAVETLRAAGWLDSRGSAS